MRIRFNENGCIVVEGAVRYVMRRNGEEEVIEKERIALCRCGNSSNKPFCDATHKTVGFQAAPVEIEIVVK